MAVDWFKSLSTLGKTAAIAGIGGALTAGAVIGYKIYQAKQGPPPDEGFDEIPKDDEPPEKRILVLGLDGSGKTSFLAALGNQQIDSAPNPTQGFNVVCVQTDKIALDIWEIGGAEKVRKYWANFIQDTDVLVFVVDSADESRLAEAYTEVHILLGDERLKNAPIVLLANKQDLPNAQSPDEILTSLGLNNISPKDHRIQALGLQVPIEGTRKGFKEAERLITNLCKK